LVKATATFTPDSNDAKAVPKGLLGKVAEIDENGDAWIAFEGLDEEQGVLRENFGNISVLSQEEAGKLEMVTMFIDAEMVTMFIDVGSDVSAKDKNGKDAFDQTFRSEPIVEQERTQAEIMAMHGPAQNLMLDDGAVFDEAVSDWHDIQVPSWFDQLSPRNFDTLNLTLTSVSWQVVTCV